MKQSALFSAISFGTAVVSLYTSNVSLLGKVIGGNMDANFFILSFRSAKPTNLQTTSVR
jgi:hypothetical protein